MLGTGILLSLPMAAAAESGCPPAATLEGEEDVVQSVAGELTRRGIETQPASECPRVKVQIKRADSTLVLRIEDPYGRQSERSFADAEAAASVVESWARQDVNTSSLAGWSYQPAQVAQPAPHPARTDGRPARDPASVAPSAEVSAGSDGSLWLGGRVTACAGWGMACVGASARLQSGTGDASSTGVDILASVDLPFYLGRTLVMPGLGLGGGWISIHYTQGQDTQGMSHSGARADAHLSILYALGGLLWLQLGVSADASLFAQTSAQNQNATTVPGEPWGYLRSDIGLRLGAP